MNVSGFKDLLNNLAELSNGNSPDTNDLQGFSAQKYNYGFDNNSRTNRAMESLTDRFVETQAAGKTKSRPQQDEKYTSKVIIIPLKKGVESIGYKELSRSLIKHTLEE